MMGSSYLPIHWLPVVIALWLPVTFAITYVLAVTAGHVYPWLPAISATGTLPPESCWFGLFVNISTFSLLFSGYIRYAQLREFSTHYPKVGPGKWANLIATIIGSISVAGLFIVANWQETNVIRVHLFGAQCCFYCGNLYFILQTVFSFWMAPKMNSLLVFILRALLSLLMVILNIGCFVSSYMAYKLFSGESIESSLQWKPSQPGWGWHVAYAAMEWSLMVVFALSVLTYYPDFKRIQLEEPALKIKSRWRGDN